MGTTTRPVDADDAPAVLRLWHAHEQAVLGRPDSTLDDVRDQLADPGLDPASAVVVDGDGRVVGCALVLHDGDSDHADVDVVTDPDAGPALLGTLLETAGRLALDGATARGHAQVQADSSCYREDVATAHALEQAGYRRATSFHRMRRALEDPVDVHLPDGVGVERVDAEDDATLRRAHRLHQATFAGHFGFTPRPYDAWLASHRARSGTGPLWFATLDRQDVGFLHETDQFVADEDAGYVWRLGVERAVRGRGVARALLLSSFADMRRRGRRAALLHVDSANDTGATRLYESVGMEPVVVIDVWRCVRPALPA